jgi:hypothetical protein
VGSRNGLVPGSRARRRLYQIRARLFWIDINCARRTNVGARRNSAEIREESESIVSWILDIAFVDAIHHHCEMVLR